MSEYCYSFRLKCTVSILYPRSAENEKYSYEFIITRVKVILKDKNEHPIRNIGLKIKPDFSQN